METPMYGRFSMAEIDEVSSKLGGIEATQTLILKSVYTMETLFKDMGEKIVLHGASQDAIHKRLDSIEPRVESLEDLEQRREGAWKTICMLATGAATVFGLCGAWLAKVLGIIN